MKNRKTLLIMFTLLYLAGSGFLTWRIFNNAYTYKSYTVANTEILNWQNRLTSPGEWLMPTSSWNDKYDKSETAIENASFYYDSAVTAGWILLAISLVYILMILFLYRGSCMLFTFLSLGLIVVAFVFLVIGVCVPMLEIGAFKSMLTLPIKFTVPVFDYDVDWKKEFPGRTYFFYQCKSVADLIAILFESGNYTVAVCILVFSIINPILKLVCGLISICSPVAAKNKFVYFVVHHIGKWSMADVFVASAFLAYLSFYNMNSGVDTESHTLIGLHFFLGFVILSILSGVLLKLADRKQKETVIIM